MSNNKLSFVMPSDVAAIDGSTKCLVFLLLIAVLLLKFGFQASTSSIINKRFKASIYLVNKDET